MIGYTVSLVLSCWTQFALLSVFVFEPVPKSDGCNYVYLFLVITPLHGCAGFVLVMDHLLQWLCRMIWIRNCNSCSIAAFAHLLYVLNLTIWGYLSYIISLLTVWFCCVNFAHFFFSKVVPKFILKVSFKIKTVDYINDSHGE